MLVYFGRVVKAVRLNISDNRQITNYKPAVNNRFYYLPSIRSKSDLFTASMVSLRALIPWF